MKKTGNKPDFHKITVIIQILCIAVMVVLIIADYRNFSERKQLLRETVPIYKEYIYYSAENEMPDFVAVPADITMILFFTVNIVSTIAAVIGRKDKIEKIIFNLIYSAVFIFEIAALTILYDDPYLYYYPDDESFSGVSYHEYSDDKNLIVIREDWFLSEGKAEVYLIDEKRNAFEIGVFYIDDSVYFNYSVELEDDGVNINFPRRNEKFFFSFEQE